MKKFIQLFIFAFFAISQSYCHGSSFEYDENENATKIYVDDLESLSITEEGLFLIDKGEVISLESISSDENGIFVTYKGVYDCEIGPIKEPTCFNGHPVYHGCGGCAVWWCNGRCKCHSPWQ